MESAQVLLCTVGTGNRDDLERSLLTPLRLSLRQGVWGKVVLLPSFVTTENAELLRADVADLPITVRPLPAERQENDAVACFDHFDAVIAGLRGEGVPAGRVVADFTRGTKAMSAALVLAAVRHDIPTLRYIVGPRDGRGAVLPGSEEVHDVPTAVAVARKRLDEIRTFFRHGNFAAAILVAEEVQVTAGWPAAVTVEAGAVSRLARFYAAWDRLDYRAATAVVLPDPAALPAEFRPLLPSDEARRRVADLAEPLPEDMSGRADALRKLVLDLFANGERRLAAHHYEDALLRAYRVLELVGQVRLFVKGYDSAALDPADERIRQFHDKVKKKGSVLPEKKGKLQAAREMVGRLLKFLEDPMGQRLIDAGKERGIVDRNDSVLIHGFDAKASDPEPLAAMYRAIKDLIVEDQPGAAGPPGFDPFAALR
jgi:CRISPR-associated protein (TIGR02710 family)